MSSFPTKLLKAKLNSAMVSSYWTGVDKGYMNYPFKWTVVISIIPQSHSDANSQNPYFYDGLDIKVGDWFSNAVGGAAWRIAAITSATIDSMTCVLEDVDQTNTLSDPTQNGDGGPAVNIDGFIFELGLDKLPILSPVVLNTLTSQWQTDLLGRFSSKIIPESGGSGGSLILFEDNAPIGNDPVTELEFVGSQVNIESSVETPGRFKISLVDSVPDAVGFKSQTVLGIEVGAASGSYADFQIFTPTSSTHNVLIHCLEIKLATLGGGEYSYSVYAGNPASNGRLIFDGAQIIGKPINDFTHTCPLPLLALSGYGNTNIWVRIYQRASYKIIANARCVSTEFKGSLSELPGYTAPPVYTGSLKMSVYVGKDGEFEEPRYALSALNPEGGTMFIQEGTYFLPIAMGNTAGNPQNFNGYNPNFANAGKFQYVNFKGEGAYKTIMNGRGGFGPGPNHPYRLAYGKGFFYSQCPYKVEDIGFIQCGGADQVDDGEAAIRSESFLDYEWIDVIRCSFDRNENGIFVANNNTNDKPGDKVNVRITECDFGMRASNGSTGAGLTHDLYINGNELEVIGCNFYGTRSEYSYGGGDSGNCIKARARSLLIEDCYVRHGNGRCFDRPEGGVTVINNTIFAAREQAVSNMFGYNNESSPDNAPQGAHDVYFNNCTIHASRYADAVWNDARGKKLDFTTTDVVWCKYNENSVTPSFSFVGSGDIVGLERLPPDGTVFQTPPEAPGSVAQPGYTPIWP